MVKLWNAQSFFDQRSLLPPAQTQYWGTELLRGHRITSLHFHLWCFNQHLRKNAAFGAYSAAATVSAGCWEKLIWEPWTEENTSMEFLLFSLFTVKKTNVNKFPISSGHIAHKSFVMLRESNTNLASFQNQFVQPVWWAVTGGEKKNRFFRSKPHYLQAQ